MRSARFSGRPWRGLWLAGIVLAFVMSGSLQADTIADSFDQWSLTGTQGESDWFYGWRNYTVDGGGDYDYTTDFIAMLNDGSGVVSQNGPNQWTGDQWDFAAEGPWTNLQQENAHPNGTNSAPNEEHWVIRRWVANSITTPIDLELRSHLRATNTNGPGTSVHLYQNGTLLDTLSTASGAGLTNSVYQIVNPGDVIDLALSPESADGDRSDGSDGTAFRLTVTDELPPPPPLGDSFDDWSTTGTQGENGWSNGYYNRSADDDGIYQAGDFTAFTPDNWSGSNYALGGNPPWTMLGQADTHPNSVSNGAEHWTIRRYVADELTEPTLVELNWQTAKSNVGCGDGVTGGLYVNGIQVDGATIAFDDGVGVNRKYYINANPGDVIDLTLGPNDPDNDGCDGSTTRLTLSTDVPDGPLYNPLFPPNVLADSVAEFSETQGQDGWAYGYYDVRDDVVNGNGSYDPGDLIPFLNDGSGVVSADPAIGGWKSSPNHWDGGKWDLLANGAPVSHGPWTEMTNVGGHPAANGQDDPEVHWAVRRWISDFAGDVRVDGLLSNGGGGDGTVGRIFVDGVEAWSELTDGDPVNVSVVLENVSNGSVIDFVIDPDGAGVLDPSDPSTLDLIADGSDGTTFQFTIQEVALIPEPSSLVLAGIALLGLAGLRRRR